MMKLEFKYFTVYRSHDFEQEDYVSNWTDLMVMVNIGLLNLIYTKREDIKQDKLRSDTENIT